MIIGLWFKNLILTGAEHFEDPFTSVEIKGPWGDAQYFAVWSPYDTLLTQTSATSFLFSLSNTQPEGHKTLRNCFLSVYHGIAPTDWYPWVHTVYKRRVRIADD